MHICMYEALLEKSYINKETGKFQERESIKE